MLSLAGVNEKSHVLDMGSGTGDILLAAAKKGAHAYGVEINPFLVWVSRFRASHAGLASQITVLRGDMFTAKMPSVDVVTMYLPSNMTARLRQKFIDELPIHAIVVSNGYAMPDWTPIETRDGVFVYRVSDIRNQ